MGVTLKVSESGEVLARSNVVLEGYWEQPEESEAALATAGSTPVTAASSARTAT